MPLIQDALSHCDYPSHHVWMAQALYKAEFSKKPHVLTMAQAVQGEVSASESPDTKPHSKPPCSQ